MGPELEIIVKGPRGSGSTTLAHYLFWYLKILGYQVDVAGTTVEREVIEKSTFYPDLIKDIKSVQIKTESYE